MRPYQPTRGAAEGAEEAKQMKITQKDRLRQLFKANPGQWVPLTDIIKLGIAMYPPRIKEIREDKKDPMDIKNKTYFKDGINHSSYMYTPGVAAYTKQEEFNYAGKQ